MCKFMGQSISNRISVALVFIVIALLLFFNLKGCVVTPVNIDDYQAYESIDRRGQISRVYLLPNNNEIISTKEFDGRYELALFKMRGSHAIKYFGSLYNIGTFPFGLRIYSDAIKVWKVNMRLINKIGNISTSTYNEIGETHEVRFVFYENELEAGGHRFQIMECSPNKIREIRGLF